MTSPLRRAFPVAGDVISIQQRAIRDLPAGAVLRLVGIWPSPRVPGWARLDVIILGEDGRPERGTSVLVPVASVTVYRDA
jgi:hypothetical protein